MYLICNLHEILSYIKQNNFSLSANSINKLSGSERPGGGGDARKSEWVCHPNNLPGGPEKSVVNTLAHVLNEVHDVTIHSYSMDKLEKPRNRQTEQCSWALCLTDHCDRTLLDLF